MRRSKPIVWVTNLGFHDYTLADRFGEIKFVTEGRINLQRLEVVEAEIQDKLKDATEDDFLALSGHMAIGILAAGYLYRKFGKVRLLIYDELIRDYLVHTTDFDMIRAIASGQTDDIQGR